jgi:hypothetical protein
MKQLYIFNHAYIAQDRLVQPPNHLKHSFASPLSKATFSKLNIILAEFKNYN